MNVTPYVPHETRTHEALVIEKPTVPSPLLRPNEAAQYLGYKNVWLSTRANTHDLFKPSVGENKKGTAPRYHIDHLNIILEHMMDPKMFPADEAFRCWKRMRAERIHELSTPRNATCRKRKLALPKPLNDTRDRRDLSESPVENMK